MLGVLARNAGEARARPGDELERSLALARRSSATIPPQAAALNNLALVRRDAGELAEALELTESALSLCAAYGDRHRQAALENNLADLHHAAGRGDEAMTHLKRAVALFSEVGADEATRLPEIWKLVELVRSDTRQQRKHGGFRSGRRGSNPRPSAWEADALPTELRPRGPHCRAGEST